MSAPTVTRGPVTGDVPVCESCRVRPAVTTVTVGAAAPFVVCGDCVPRPAELADAVTDTAEVDPVADLGAAVVMAGGRVRRQYVAADGWAVVEAVAPVASWFVPVVTVVAVPVGALSVWFSTGSPLGLVGTGIGLAVAGFALDGVMSR